MKQNNDVRLKAKQKGVYLYEIAERFGVTEFTFHRWMRKELSQATKSKVFRFIDEIADEHKSEVSP